MNFRWFFFLTTWLATAFTVMASHTMIDGVLEQSTIYPGTVHTFQVYVPSQYDGKRPAALYVGLDGVLCNAPQVMDSLIAAGKMPVAIGVFLQPGVIKDKDGTVLRYNRCYEFDSTTGNFAAFLESELLPAVEQMKTSKGKQSPAQKVWQREMESRGYRYIVCHSFDEFREAIDDYLLL